MSAAPAPPTVIARTFVEDDMTSSTFDFSQVTGAQEYCYSVPVRVDACAALTLLSCDEASRVQEFELCEAGSWWQPQHLASASVEQCDLSGVDQVVTKHPVFQSAGQLWVLLSDQAIAAVAGDEDAAQVFATAARFPMRLGVAPQHLTAMVLTDGDDEVPIAGALWSLTGDRVDALTLGGRPVGDEFLPDTGHGFSISQRPGTFAVTLPCPEGAFPDEDAEPIAVLFSNHDQSGVRKTVGSAQLAGESLTELVLTLPVKSPERADLVGLGCDRFSLPTVAVGDGLWVSFSGQPADSLTDRSLPMTPLALASAPDDICGYLLGPADGYLGMHWFLP